MKYETRVKPEGIPLWHPALEMKLAIPAWHCFLFGDPATDLPVIVSGLPPSP